MYNRTISDIEHTLTDTKQGRYWSPASQAHATGDQLMRYLHDGWTLDKEVGVETVWFGEARHIVIYHFRLRQGTAQCVMPVLSNPFTNGLVNDSALGLQRVDVQREGEQLRFAVIEQRPAKKTVR